MFYNRMSSRHSFANMDSNIKKGKVHTKSTNNKENQH